MLLVLRHWRLPRNNLHLHRARQKELLLLLLVLEVDAINGSIGGRHSPRYIHSIHSDQVVLHLSGMPVVHVHQLGLVVVSPRRGNTGAFGLLVVVLVQLMDVETATALVHIDS